jgi:hypothetical protein
MSSQTLTRLYLPLFHPTSSNKTPTPSSQRTPRNEGRVKVDHAVVAAAAAAAVPSATIRTERNGTSMPRINEGRLGSRSLTAGMARLMGGWMGDDVRLTSEWAYCVTFKVDLQADK